MKAREKAILPSNMGQICFSGSDLSEKARLGKIQVDNPSGEK